MMDKTHILEDPEGVYHFFQVRKRRLRQQAGAHSPPGLQVPGDRVVWFGKKAGGVVK